MIFIAIGGDAWVIQGLARTYDARRRSPTRPRIGTLVGGAQRAFVGDLRRRRSRSPRRCMLALIITDAAFGVVSRVVPQLNVFAVGFPAKMTVGLLLIGVVAAVRRRLARATSCSSSRRCRPSRRSGSRSHGRAHDKTEKATPKKREEARKKGQVAKSPDLNGAVVLLAGAVRARRRGPAASSTTCADAMHDMLARR